MENLSGIGKDLESLESRKMVNFPREKVKVFCFETESYEENVFSDLPCTQVLYWKL